MTVKEKKRGRPSGKSSQLNTQSILDCAKVMMREEGKIPSIRKLATQLGVDAMAIYYYFENKNALLEAITTSLIEEIYEPAICDKKSYEEKISKDWQQELIELSKSYISLLSNYPGLLETLLGMTSTSPAHVFSERFERVVQPLTLTPEDLKNALDLLADYLHGFALAMNCQNGDAGLTVENIAGPLKLYCHALKNC